MPASDTGGVYIILDTEVATGKFKRNPVARAEAFDISSAMDTDADSFTVEFGDPQFNFSQLVTDRDIEVRVSLFLKKDDRYPLLTGFADSIIMDTTGTLNISGRDVSSPAADSQAPPQIMRNIKPERFVAKEAVEQGFSRTLLKNTKSVIADFVRDGNETYWESWYRAFRKRNMWMWVEPDGILVADVLRYDASTTYFFGEKPDRSDRHANKTWHKVTDVRVTKNTQSRVYQPIVIGIRGDRSFIVDDVRDRTLDRWIKKRRVFVVNEKAVSENEGRETAYETIFEGKVGALELAVTLPYKGFIVRQNHVARLRLPRMGIDSRFYVVGTRIVGGLDGFTQEIRLRERKLALSREMPDDPEFAPEAGLPSGGIAEHVMSIAGVEPEGWDTFFIKAAKQWHRSCGVDYNFFLACILAICERESHFRNVIWVGGNSPGIVYRPPPTGDIRTGRNPNDPGGMGADRGQVVRADHAMHEWRETFRNENVGLLGGGTVPQRAVGPMQLHTLSFKHEADDRYKPNYRDQWLGGRWHPEHNIWAGAHAFAQKITAANAKLGLTVPERNRIILGMAYYYGDTSGTSEYARSVFRNAEEKWLKQVKTAITAAQENAATGGTPTGGGYGPGATPKQTIDPKTIDRSTGNALRARVVNEMTMGRLNFWNIPDTHKFDIISGRISDRLLRVILAIIQQWGAIYSYALKSDHDPGSNHERGEAIDINNFVAFGDYAQSFPGVGIVSTPEKTKPFMKWVINNRVALGGVTEFIGAYPELCYPVSSYVGPSFYSARTLDQHKNHIHIGFDAGSVPS